MTEPHNLTSIVVVAEGLIPHSQFYRGGHGLAGPAFSLLSSWSREGGSPHSHFYHGGRGMADAHKLTSIELAAEWPIPHSHFYRGGPGVADPAFALLS